MSKLDKYIPFICYGIKDNTYGMWYKKQKVDQYIIALKDRETYLETTISTLNKQVVTLKSVNTTILDKLDEKDSIIDLLRTRLKLTNTAVNIFGVCVFCYLIFRSYLNFTNH